MSIRALSWVLEHSEEKLSNRLVLIVLADHAHEDGSMAWPAVETIARSARLSTRQVQISLKDLEANGSITHTGTSKAGTKIWRVNTNILRGEESAPPADHSPKSEHSAPEPSLNHPELDEDSAREDARVEGVHIGGGSLMAGGRQPRFAKVGQRKVTLAEDDFAEQVLKAFDETFPSPRGYRGRDHYVGIVERLRERPELTLEDFLAAIANTKAGPAWWSRNGGPSNPTPRHIFGSSRAFDAALNAEPTKGDGASDGDGGGKGSLREYD